MIVIADIIKTIIKNPEFGWLIVLGYLYMEIRTPRGRLQKIDQRVLAVTTVVRALARVHGDVKTSEVDDYLVENGQEPEDFIGPEEGLRNRKRKTGEVHTDGGIKDKNKLDAKPGEKTSVNESPMRPTDDDSGVDPGYQRGFDSVEEGIKP